VQNTNFAVAQSGSVNILLIFNEIEYIRMRISQKQMKMKSFIGVYSKTAQITYKNIPDLI